MPAADYLERARGLAATAVRAAGLEPAEVKDGPLFDFLPRPMQEAAAEVALCEGPMLAVIEDETGTGKTEAALILARRMLAAPSDIEWPLRRSSKRHMPVRPDPESPRIEAIRRKTNLPDSVIVLTVLRRLS